MTSFKYFGRKRTPKDPRRLIIQRKGYGDNWPEQRERARKRDNYQCQKCGFHGSKNSRGQWNIHVHHIRKIVYYVDTSTGTINYEKANDLSNLITLCIYCHVVADGHKALPGGFKVFR